MYFKPHKKDIILYSQYSFLFALSLALHFFLRFVFSCRIIFFLLENPMFLSVQVCW